MENRIIKFANEKFGEIRTMSLNNVPWFLGKDVAVALGYANPHKAILNYVDADDCNVLKYKASPNLGKASGLWNGNDYSDKTFINESGIYALIFSSKLDSAKDFKRWVTAEVLPQIRKTGGYIPVHDVYGHQRSYATTMITGLGVQHLLDKFKSLNS